MNNGYNNWNSNQFNYGNFKPKKTSNLGLVIALIITAIVFGIIALIVAVAIKAGKELEKKFDDIKSNINSNINSNDDSDERISIYYGEGYEIFYNSTWKKDTAKTSDGESVNILVADNKSLAFIPNGISPLSKLEIDFSKEEGKKKLYKYFYDYWQLNLNSSDEKLISGTETFLNLDDNIYYAYIDLETSSNKTGRLFVLVSPEKNAIISCEFKISKDFDKNSELALELLKGIKITKQFDEN